jgi:hypothetical protein
MDRIPSALELNQSEINALRRIVGRSFTPRAQINALHRSRLTELGLVQSAMGGLMATPAGRIVSRM